MNIDLFSISIISCIISLHLCSKDSCINYAGLFMAISQHMYGSWQLIFFTKHWVLSDSRILTAGKEMSTIVNFNLGTLCWTCSCVKSSNTHHAKSGKRNCLANKFRSVVNRAFKVTHSFPCEVLTFKNVHFLTRQFASQKHMKQFSPIKGREQTLAWEYWLLHLHWYWHQLLVHSTHIWIKRFTLKPDCESIRETLALCVRQLWKCTTYERDNTQLPQQRCSVGAYLDSGVALHPAICAFKKPLRLNVFVTAMNCSLLRLQGQLPSRVDTNLTEFQTKQQGASEMQHQTHACQRNSVFNRRRNTGFDAQ